MNASNNLADLTNKARIRSAALNLFGSLGYSETSLRLIAEEAGVSIGLINHHFDSKEALRDAVEQAIVLEFNDNLQALRSPRTFLVQYEMFVNISKAASRLIDANLTVRCYLRRVLLEFLSDVRSAPIFIELFQSIQSEIECSGGRYNQAGGEWRALQCFLLLFGPAVFAPALEKCAPDLFEEIAARDRQHANAFLLDFGACNAVPSSDG